MAEFKRIASANNLAPGKGTTVKVGNKQIALFNVEGNFYAIDNTCTHSGGPLGEGRLAGTAVTCPWHGARFDVTSGKLLTPPATSDVASYPTKIEDGDIWVELPE